MARLEAVKIILKLLDKKQSLNELKTEIAKVPARDRPLVQELCYGVARWYFQLAFILNKLLKKPLKIKDQDIYAILLIGLYQLFFTRIPAHAAVHETVNLARSLNKEWATQLINAILRNSTKQKEAIFAAVAKNPAAYYAHPNWLLEMINRHWPSQKDQILSANNQHPSFCLRVNTRKISREAYLDLLKNENLEAVPIPFTDQGIQLLHAIDLGQLPHFDQGYVSVQDGAAQLAAQLLEPQANETILDACAAPGGKAGHILELQPDLKKLVAVDSDPKRISRITENLQRLDLTATIINQDVSDLSWWQGDLFDRILLDAPCSALGVISRNPDIKLLRKPTDIEPLAKLQYQLLTSVWQILKVGGKLVYVTCSILPAENEEVLLTFMTHHTNCKEQKIQAEWGIKRTVGRQILPGMHPGMDGFYYAALIKT